MGNGKWVLQGERGEVEDVKIGNVEQRVAPVAITKGT